MTTTTTDPDLRVVPEWELCDRMRRSMRLVPGMDTTDVGEFMGVRRETVSTWLTGRRTPNYATLVLWADMTGVDRDWLITGVYAIRDSNPEPADMEHGVVLLFQVGVNRRLTANWRAA